MIDPSAAGTDASTPIRVLFVCTHNSARSVMAEILLRRKGGDAFEVYSAGTEPAAVRPLTLRVLQEGGFDTSGLRSKSVDEFLGQRFDYVITVCDQARQSCPVFPGSGESLHWGYEDPSEASGTDEEKLAVYRRVFTQIGNRIGQFVPIATRSRAEASKSETHSATILG
ncbi:MAG: arsenate reductase ArsC [Chloroflexota bacterium]|nr:arsenate reductase ArsC [Chloroflexota bacterium]